ncbi:MAG: hypothetical protein II978_05490 [Clostridia bacterium]|nr:hypothetical protein [Clostridia bacterium]
MSLESLAGKKLLILAGDVNFVTLVKRAKELGIYTIVTDYYDTKQSPAKLVADEYWNISWDDIDALEKKCREENINGVTTGYSESPVGCCIELCERLGLPCYSTKEQLELTKDKVLFKDMCRKNGVPVVNEYATLEEVNSFPVIVKPVDRAGSIGISVATNTEELQKAYDYAMEKSYSKSVIIEDFICSGSKFDVIYAICSGKPILVSDCDTINAQDNGFERVVQSGWLYPSHYHSFFMEKVDASIQKMIKNLGVKDGYIFFSGFAIERDGDVEFVFFETGYRLNGGHTYTYMSERGIVNILDLFIIHALTGSTELLEWKEEKNPGLKCAMVNYYAADGKVSEFKGLDEIENMDDCSILIQFGKVGDKCDTQRAILSKMSMVHFCNHSPEKLAEDVAHANNVYSVRDENGNDMVYDRMDPSVITKWWDKK